MKYRVLEFEPSFNEINFKISNVLSYLGFAGEKAPQEYICLIKALYKESESYIKPRCGYVLLSEGDIFSGGSEVHLKGVVFKTERIISRPLREMEQAAIFAATIGAQFDRRAKETFTQDDPLKGYILDIIGSEMAEGTADWLENKIKTAAQLQGKQCSNRYSPGYCGWDVGEQHKLFSFLPENFCGIRLTDSALMTPHKSLSGIIGIGKEIKRQALPCDVCTLEHCYKNRKAI